MSGQVANRVLLFLLLAAMVLRVAVVLATRHDLVFRVPYLDAAFYHFWAQSLATHNGDFVDAYFLGPLYPHVLSWIYRIGWTDILVLRLLQTLLGCINLALVLHLGRRLHSPTAGLVAALLLAFHGTLFFYEGILVMESLMTTLILGACTLLLLPVAQRPARVGAIIGAGLLLGVATVGRGTVLLLLPVSLWMLWRPLPLNGKLLGRTPADAAPPDRLGQWVGLAPLLLVVAWALCLVPQLRHNAARGSTWTLTTNAGVNFYAGNHEGSRGRFRPPPGVAFFQDMVDLNAAHLSENADSSRKSLPPALAKRALTTRAVTASDRAADSAYWFQQAGAWIAAKPMDYAGLLLRKTALVMQGHEIGQIESPSFHRQRLPLLRVFWVGWSLLLSLAVVGAWSGLRNRGNRAVVLRLTLLILTLLLPCIAFFVTARYRLVAVPLLCVLAGMGATTLFSQWRQQRSRFWICLLLLIVVFALTRVGGKPSPSRQAWENAQMAERLYTSGQLDEAIAYQEVAQQLQPQRLEIQLNLALYWSERGAVGDLQGAEQMLRGLAGRFPDRPVVLFNWASLLEQTGDTTGARRVYRRVLELDPALEAARQNLRALDRR